jgi:hypothetical protein
MNFNAEAIIVSLNYTLHMSHIRIYLHSRTFSWALLQLTHALSHQIPCLSLTTSQLTWSPRLSFLQLLGTDHIGTPRSNSTSIVARRFNPAGTCVLSRCSEKDRVYPPISWSLHSNGSTRYIIILQQPIALCIVPYHESSWWLAASTKLPLVQKYSE